jgi:hypothetical protein
MTEQPKHTTKAVPKNLPWGTYVWRNADGTALSDGEGRVLSLDGFKGDLVAIQKMRRAAAHYGSADGDLAFIPGSRKISDSEWEDQMAAFIDGDPIPGDIDA